jgi:hypothetical protein
VAILVVCKATLISKVSAPIVVEGLTKRYGRVKAVDDLSFAVRAGAVTGFLGPKGRVQLIPPSDQRYGGTAQNSSLW